MADGNNEDFKLPEINFNPGAIQIDTTELEKSLNAPLAPGLNGSTTAAPVEPSVADRIAAEERDNEVNGHLDSELPRFDPAEQTVAQNAPTRTPGFDSDIPGYTGPLPMAADPKPTVAEQIAAEEKDNEINGRPDSELPRFDPPVQQVDLDGKPVQPFGIANNTIPGGKPQTVGLDGKPVQPFGLGSGAGQTAFDPVPAPAAQVAVQPASAAQTPAEPQPAGRPAPEGQAQEPVTQVDNTEVGSDDDAPDQDAPPQDAPAATKPNLDDARHVAKDGSIAVGFHVAAKDGSNKPENVKAVHQTLSGADLKVPARDDKHHVVKEHGKPKMVGYNEAVPSSDGTPGPRMHDGIHAFQQKVGMSKSMSDGKAGRVTLAAMDAYNEFKDKNPDGSEKDAVEAAKSAWNKELVAHHKENGHKHNAEHDHHKQQHDHAKHPQAPTVNAKSHHDGKDGAIAAK